MAFTCQSPEGLGQKSLGSPSPRGPQKLEPQGQVRPAKCRLSEAWSFAIFPGFRSPLGRLREACLEERPGADAEAVDGWGRPRLLDGLTPGRARVGLPVLPEHLPASHIRVKGHISSPAAPQRGLTHIF